MTFLGLFLGLVAGNLIYNFITSAVRRACVRKLIRDIPDLADRLATAFDIDPNGWSHQGNCVVYRDGTCLSFVEQDSFPRVSDRWGHFSDLTIEDQDKVNNAYEQWQLLEQS